jgi:uncharacterized BrkB/YihY/UPF0761 family membrane protein
MTKELFFVLILVLATIVVCGFIIVNSIWIGHLKLDDEHDQKLFQASNRNVNIVTMVFVIFVMVLMWLF